MRADIIPLLSDIGAREPVLASIRAGYDTGKSGVGKPFRSVGVGESINDIYHLVIYHLVIYHFVIYICADGRAWETESSVVSRHDIVVIPDPGCDGESYLCPFLYLLHIPFSVVLADIDHIIRRFSRRFDGVRRSLPSEQSGMVNSQLCDRHRLDGGVSTVEESQYPLIDGSRRCETESGIQSVAHVRHVLMAEQFEDNRRHDRHSRFAIVSFPELASGPFRRKMAEVLCDLCLDPVGEIAVGCLPVSAVPQGSIAVIVLGGIDNECTDDSGVISAVLSVGMKGEA